MAAGSALVAEAQRIADEVLFPAALVTDAADIVWRELLDVLADAGLYGLFVPERLGGLGADPATGCLVIEALAGGCLTTTFVWLQHQFSAVAISASEPAMRSLWIGDLASGRRRSGVAFAHLRRPGPPVVLAELADHGWIVSGSAPWVTGWDRIDLVVVGARSGDDVVWLLVDAVASDTMRADRLRLAALDASATVELHFSAHVVPASRVIAIEPLQEWMARDAAGMRTNGSLALGIAARCARLLESTALDDRIGECRAALDTAGIEQMPAARAAVSVLAVEAAATLVASVGGRSMVRDHHAQRLAREALFLLVQGQTPTIRLEQRRSLGL